jgi:hypothetical protein
LLEYALKIASIDVEGKISSQWLFMSQLGKKNCEVKNCKRRGRGQGQKGGKFMEKYVKNLVHMRWG